MSTATTIAPDTTTRPDSTSRPDDVIDPPTQLYRSLVGILSNSVTHLTARVSVLWSIYKAAGNLAINKRITGAERHVLWHLSQWMTQQLDVLKKELASLPAAGSLLDESGTLSLLYTQLQANHTGLVEEKWTSALGPYLASLVRALGAKGYDVSGVDVPIHSDHTSVPSSPSYNEVVTQEVSILTALIGQDTDASILVPAMRCYLLQLLCLWPPSVYETIVSVLPRLHAIASGKLKCRAPVLLCLLDLDCSEPKGTLLPSLLSDLMCCSLQGDGTPRLDVIKALTAHISSNGMAYLPQYQNDNRGPSRLYATLYRGYTADGWVNEQLADKEGQPPTQQELDVVASGIFATLPMSLTQRCFLLLACSHRQVVAESVLSNIHAYVQVNIPNTEPDDAEYDHLLATMTVFCDRVVTAGDDTPYYANLVQLLNSLCEMLPDRLQVAYLSISDFVSKK